MPFLVEVMEYVKFKKGIERRNNWMRADCGGRARPCIFENQGYGKIGALNILKEVKCLRF